MTLINKIEALKSLIKDDDDALEFEDYSGNAVRITREEFEKIINILFDKELEETSPCSNCQEHACENCMYSKYNLGV